VTLACGLAEIRMSDRILEATVGLRAFCSTQMRTISRPSSKAAGILGGL
jgi:hypothetical protein